MTSSDRPISVVLQDILKNLQGIVRSEVRLAKTELFEDATSARSASIVTAVGAVLAMFSVLFLLLAFVYALSLEMPSWAAALIVAGGTALVAGFAVSLGLKRFKSVRGVPKTVANVKENFEWAKQQIK